MTRLSLSVAAIAAFAAVVSVAAVAHADPRPFTFRNDTYAVGKGNWEYEQHVTWRKHKESETRYDRVDFRHEFEFGLADNFDIAFYLPSWYYEDTNEPFFIRIVEDDVKPGSKESMLRTAAEIRAYNDAEDAKEQREAELERRTERIVEAVMVWAHCLGNMEAFVRSKEKIKDDIKRILKEEFDAHDGKAE